VQIKITVKKTKVEFEKYINVGNDLAKVLLNILISI
jgi:hypothetical protein